MNPHRNFPRTKGGAGITPVRLAILRMCCAENKPTLREIADALGHETHGCASNNIRWLRENGCITGSGWWPTKNALSYLKRIDAEAERKAQRDAICPSFSAHF